MMWFNIFNPFTWLSMFNKPARPELVAPVDEEDLPDDFDSEIEEDFEETAE